MKRRLEMTNTEYARDNILQSLENAYIYASYISDYGLRYEIEEMTARFKKRVEKRLSEKTAEN